MNSIKTALSICVIGLLSTIIPAVVCAQSFIVDVDAATPGIQTSVSVAIGTSPIPVDILMLSPGPGGMPTGFTAYAIATEYNDVPGVLGPSGSPDIFDATGAGLLGTVPVGTIFDLTAPGGPPITLTGVPLGSLAFAPAASGPGGPFTASDGGSGVFTIPPTAFFGGPAFLPPPGTPILLHTVLLAATGLGTSDVAPIGLFPCTGYPFCAPLPGPPVPPAAVVGPAAWPAVAELYDEPTGIPIAAIGFPPIIPGAITVTGGLPVELVDFSGRVSGRRVFLSWETASETDNLGFEIQHLYRSTTVPSIENWRATGFVDGLGSETSGHSYQFATGDLTAGAHLFRLKQIDVDGGSSYSDNIEVEIELPVSHVLGNAYPNPFNPTSVITLAVNRDQDVRLEVFDLTGRRVEVLHTGLLSADVEYRFVFEARDLSSGVYVYRAEGQYFVASKKVALLR